jgi:hypothetical protein
MSIPPVPRGGSNSFLWCLLDLGLTVAGSHVLSLRVIFNLCGVYHFLCSMRTFRIQNVVRGNVRQDIPLEQHKLHTLLGDDCGDTSCW